MLQTASFSLLYSTVSKKQPETDRFTLEYYIYIYIYARMCVYYISNNDKARIIKENACIYRVNNNNNRDWARVNQVFDGFFIKKYNSSLRVRVRFST